MPFSTNLTLPIPVLATRIRRPAAEIATSVTAILAVCFATTVLHKGDDAAVAANAVEEIVSTAVDEGLFANVEGLVDLRLVVAW